MSKIPTDAQWSDLVARIKAKAETSALPTKVSDLTNDSDFQTGTQVSSAIGTAIAGVTQFDYQVVSSLPTTGVKGTIYLVSHSGSGQDVYDEFVYVNNAWEQLGANFTLPTASASTLGGVKVGSGLSIDGNGVLTATGVSMILYNTTGQNTDGAMTQKAVTDELALKATASSLATVATSGSYADLTNKPTIPAAQIQADWTQSDNTKLDYIKNKPSFATVATSGSYNDLSNKPTIPAAQIQSDWTQTSTTAKDYIKNKPTLAAVATSGSYADLSNTPDVPATFTTNEWNALWAQEGNKICQHTVLA